MWAVPAEKLSIALEEPVAEAAREAAKSRGMSLSAWLNEASRAALAVEDGLAAVAEWEAEHGLLLPVELAAADESLDSAAPFDRAA
jgi:hypothetical protein